MTMGIVRKLKGDERALLAGLIAGEPQAHQLLNSLDDAIVEEMDDGGMGSLRFCDSGGEVRRFGKQLVEREFADIDGVPVIVTINLDNQGALYELDIWKVDFSPLKKLPSTGDA